MATAPHHPDPGAEAVVAPAQPAVRRPSLWRVVMVNDNFTPMEFVVFVLVEVFDMPLEQAAQTMLAVHHRGQAIVGTYSREIAMTKAQEAQARAEQEGHPLLLRLEPAPGQD